MRILHVIKSVDPTFGGPPAVAVQLSSAQALAGHQVLLISGGGVKGAKELPESFAWVPGLKQVEQVMLDLRETRFSRGSTASQEELRSVVRGADVMHLHGVWDTLLWSASEIATECGVPYIVRPAGMLDPWSLSQKWLKKRAALLMRHRRMLNGAMFVHALNRDERDLVGLLGLRCPVEVVPNGMFEESVAGAPPAGTFRRSYPVLGEDPYILFLSRLHHKKGLDYLALMFASLAPRLPNMKLVVAGPDDGARPAFEAMIQSSGLSNRVIMTGPLYGEKKLAAMRDAIVFCLPSRQEGFSVAILESLAMGLPAVISEECHFPEVEISGSGRVLPLEPRLFAEAIHTIVQNPEIRASMSATGQKLIMDRYTWRSVASQCVELYKQHGVGVVDGGGVAVARSRGGRAAIRNFNPTRQRIVHVVNSLDPAAGGPPYVAVKLATAQALDGHDVRMLTYRSPTAQNDIRAAMNQIPHADLVEQHYIPAPSLFETLTGTNAARVMRSMLSKVDVVHLHGVWEMQLLRVADECRKAGVGYVITPHGMLDPWSLSQSKFKKRVAMALATRKMLNGSMFIHVLNRDEEDLLQPLGLDARYELIANGVFEHEVSDLPERGAFRKIYPQLGEKPYVLFLSRLHFKKGLDYLADMFALLAAELPDVQLVVAGPDGGARADFESRISRAKLQDRVLLTGPLYGREKIAAIVDASAFCLPSRQEGFSLAITEAMGVGCPCVVSEACHYPEVEEAGAGYITNLVPREIADALIKVLTDPEKAAAMGRAGKQLVLTQFTWPVIARKASSAYTKYIQGKWYVQGK